eukprot:UN13743
MVSDESEQKDIIRDLAWRSASQLLHDVLFAPVVVALMAGIASEANATVTAALAAALLFYTVISLLIGVIWEEPVPGDALIDVRLTGMQAGGTRLFLTVALLATLRGQQELFLIGT